MGLPIRLEKHFNVSVLFENIDPTVVDLLKFIS
jgi:hypothetical protein